MMVVRLAVALAVFISAVEPCKDGELQGVGTNCKVYKQCTNGKWTALKCKDGLMWKNFNGCVEETKSCASSCDGLHMRPHATDPTQFERCVDKKWAQIQCNKGDIFSPEKSCDSQQCTPGELRPIRNNSQKFEICCNSGWNLDSCPSRMVFDNTTFFCVSPESLGQNLTNPLRCGNVSEVAFKPTQSNCPGYDPCVYGEWVPTNCPEGTKLNPGKEYCVKNTNSECKEYIENLCSGSFRKDVHDCSGFQECYKRQWTKQKCPPDMIWSADYSKCVKNNGSCKPACTHGQIKASNNTTCVSDFYACCNNAWVKEQCPLKLVYDPIKKSCGTLESCSLSVPCGATPEGSFRSAGDDCEAFELCYRGGWIRESCPEGLMWNSNNLYCVEKSYTCKPCKGKVAGSLRPESKCGQGYFMCLRESFILQSCPGGMIFDPVLLYCTKKSKECGGDEKPSCGEKPQGSLRLSKDRCNQYEECYRGIWLQKDCSTGSMFNSTSLECVKNDGSCKVCSCL